MMEILSDVPQNGSNYAELYSYDLLNRMTYSYVNDVETEYKYRPDGLRYSKNGTVHIWDGANIVGEVGGATYVRGIGLIKSGANYCMFNAHGDVVQVGSKTYDYDAFGVEKSPDEMDVNPWRYCGEYYDVETGTVYLRARYYQPLTGRFTTEDTHWNVDNMIYGNNPVKWNEREPDEKDPTGLNTYTYKPDIHAIMQSGNLYGYCMNNPLMYVDSNGNWVVAVVGGVSITLGMAVAAGVGLTLLADLIFNDLKFTKGLIYAIVNLGMKTANAIKSAIDNISKSSPINPKLVDDKYLKRNGIDPHSLKREVLGDKAAVKEYDIYIDRNGDVYLKRKGSSVYIPTGDNINDR